MMYLLLPFQAPAFNGAGVVAPRSAALRAPAAELKHGRAAMLGSVGYLIGAAGITFPGEIAKGVSFASVNSDGVYNAWAKVPEEGKLQILCLLLALETANE